MSTFMFFKVFYVMINIYQSIFSHVAEKGLRTHNSASFLPAAVKAKISRRRVPSSEPELTVEGPVEFIQRGPLLPYDTSSLLQRWLLINLRCAHTLVRPGRAQLYLITGTMRANGSIELSNLFPWLKKDLHITSATRKWKHHKCWTSSRLWEEKETIVD